jgi:CO/xanthine dehydrogenase Mo-binding subunit
MDSNFPIRRRTFLKTMASGVAVSLTISSLPNALLAANESASKTSASSTKVNDWAPTPGVANRRIDGLAKVQGQKVYARDIHSKDLNGWPVEQNYLYALRTNTVTQSVVGYDISMLPASIAPIAVIDSIRLQKAKISLPSSMKKAFFSSLGKVPDYYGQPVAMLIFRSFADFRKAKKMLQFNTQVIQYQGSFQKRTPTIYPPETSFVRDDSQNFNYANNPDDYKETSKVVAESVRDSIKNSDWNLFQNDFKTQTMDPMFMEPESGLAWYDGNQNLKLVLGTQSPTGDIEEAAEIFQDDGCKYPVNNVELISCYPGGGFGGRDKSYFSMYIAMAAAFSDRPIRWLHDRFEQFQIGLKRHHTLFSETLAVDNNGMFQALECDFTFNGGGRGNLSPYVAQLAAMSSFSAYNIPKAIANAKALDTPDLVGGSQRGFGGPQAFIATETLVDQAAKALNLDPFDIRRKNLLSKSHGKTITGAPIAQHLQLNEILDTLEKQPIWQNRFATQKQFASAGKKYGVGLALSNQAYGTSGDGMFAGIEILPTGELKAYTPYIDMGNGAATALGLAPATFLGRNANQIEMGESNLFDSLGLTTDKDRSTSPNYVLKASGSASACLAAFHQYHAMEHAGQALMLNSVLPAANSIWRAQLTIKQVAWQDGKLTSTGFTSIDWSDLVAVILTENSATMAAVHATFIGSFATADFAFKNQLMSLPLDYIAMGTDRASLSTISRSNVSNPPSINARYGRTTYAPCGALISVSIDPASNQIQVEDCVSVLSAGKQHCFELISGQSQGGIAMSIGYTLKEDCPNTDAGPGNGTWNLDKYHIARQQDIPLNQQLIILDPAPGETTARGIAEAVMCPIPPAILNALAMATNGHRFTQLPVTSDDVQGALL